MENVWNAIVKWLEANGASLVTALVILVLGRIVVGIIIGIVRRLMRRANVDETLTGFVANITRFALMLFVVLAALNELGVQTTSFIAVIGAAGLAVGLALQGSLGNFASGVMLVLFKPFKKGDYVEAGGTSGSVEEISIFHTVLRTPDNKRVIVPNGGITGGNITNYSAHETRRVDLVFGIGYSDDIDQARAVITEILSADDRVLKDPAPTVALLELADSSVNFAVRPWVKTSDYWAVLFDVNEKVKKTFDARGIGIPFPQRDVHLYQMPAK
jgi:small conductance mechanosensitive channel